MFRAFSPPEWLKASMSRDELLVVIQFRGDTVNVSGEPLLRLRSGQARTRSPRRIRPMADGPRALPLKNPFVAEPEAGRLNQRQSATQFFL